MKTVYIVMADTGADRDFGAVFSDRERAEAYQDFAYPDGYVFESTIDSEEVPSWHRPGHKRYYAFWSSNGCFDVSTENNGPEDWEFEPVREHTFNDGTRQAVAKTRATDRGTAIELLVQKLEAAGFDVTDEMLADVRRIRIRP